MRIGFSSFVGQFANLLVWKLRKLTLGILCEDYIINCVSQVSITGGCKGSGSNLQIAVGWNSFLGFLSISSMQLAGSQNFWVSKSFTPVVQKSIQPEILSSANIEYIK